MHDHHQKLTPHYLIRACLLTGFSLYVVHLVKIEKLQYYIVPRMIPYVKYAAMALFLLAGYFVYSAIKHSYEQNSEEDCDCGHEPPRSVFKSVLIYGLFAMPLLLGFALPDKIMGSDVATVKGMNLNVSAVQQSKKSTLPIPSNSPSPSPDQSIAPSTSPEASPISSSESSSDPAATATIDTVSSSADPLDKLFPADEYSLDFAKLGKKLYKRDIINIRTEGFLEMLTMLDMFRNNFIGTTVVISGFIYREAGMDTDQFVVSRMAMQCCSADAMPYGFLVKSGMGANLKKDEWVSLTGVIGLTQFGGNEIIQLDARKITKIKAPEDPYVYPYFDDFDKLGDNALVDETK
jgi:putative membrane protein